jgi:hypothetical protein
MLKSSELESFARVVRTVDLSPFYVKDHCEIDIGHKVHSFLTRTETIALVHALPEGSVAVWISDITIQVFLRSNSVYDRILARADGTWDVNTACVAEHVLPGHTSEAELLIFEKT